MSIKGLYKDCRTNVHDINKNKGQCDLFLLDQVTCHTIEMALYIMYTLSALTLLFCGILLHVNVDRLFNCNLLNHLLTVSSTSHQSHPLRFA